VLLELIQLPNELLFSGGSFWPTNAGFGPKNFIPVPFPGDKISTSLQTDEHHLLHNLVLLFTSAGEDVQPPQNTECQAVWIPQEVG